MLVPFFVSLAACVSGADHGGTAIGNPTGMSAAVAPADGIQFKDASVDVGAVELTGCDDSTARIAVDRTLDLLHLDRIALPAGIWCAVDVELTSDVLLSGNAQGGGKFDMTLQLSGLTLDAVDALGTKEEEYILEFGAPGWTSADALNLSGGADRSIDVSSDEYDELVAKVSSGATIFVDDDENGALNDKERAHGAVAKSRGRSDAAASKKHGKGHADDTGS